MPSRPSCKGCECVNTILQVSLPTDYRRDLSPVYSAHTPLYNAGPIQVPIYEPVGIHVLSRIEMSSSPTCKTNWRARCSSWSRVSSMATASMRPFCPVGTRVPTKRLTSISRVAWRGRCFSHRWIRWSLPPAPPSPCCNDPSPTNPTAASDTRGRTVGGGSGSATALASSHSGSGRSAAFWKHPRLRSVAVGKSAYEHVKAAIVKMAKIPGKATLAGESSVSRGFYKTSYASGQVRQVLTCVRPRNGSWQRRRDGRHKRSRRWR